MIWEAKLKAEVEAEENTSKQKKPARKLNEELYQREIPIEELIKEGFKGSERFL